MWLLSAVVTVVVLYLANGRQLPPPVVDQLNLLVPDDSGMSKRDLALSFLVGVGIAGTPLHSLVRYLSTVVHELGHAFTAGLLGGRPKQITIATNGSGLATYYPPVTWGRIRASIVSLAGYPAPSIAAIAAVQAAQGGHVKSWFAFAAGTLALAIVMLIRNFWGFAWTAAVVAGSYFGARELDVQFLGWIVGAVAGFLALEGYRNAWQQLVIVRHASGSGCDAEMVAHWWRFSPRVVASSHLLVVTGFTGIATHLAVGPYWTEIQEWLSTLL
jgi:hypothetical protein